jgi:hypothetical protein
MGRVLPSQAVEIIQRTYRWASQGGSAQIPPESVTDVGMILAVVEAVPEELLPAGEDRVVFVAALGALRATVTRWQAGGHPGLNVHLGQSAGIAKHPMTALHDVLMLCHDDAPGVDERALPFIIDEAAHRSILLDITNASRALGNSEWKAATVLAGSIAEALLLWAVSQHDEPARLAAAQRWKDADPDGYNGRVMKKPPEEWYLGDFAEIAHELGEISDATRRAVRLTSDYRALIHPGRVLRTGADATQGTAHLATGAMREVASDLARKHHKS